jgi:hypothetical protein
MNWSRLIFRDKFTVNADYTEMVSYFRKRLDKNYFERYIDKHQTELLCYWQFSSRRIGLPLPVCQLNFKNEKDRDGKIVVRFKIVNSLTVALIVLLGAVSYGTLVMNLEIGFAFVFPAFVYLYLTFRYYVDFSGLMHDIRKIESHHTSQQLR